jgi:hypothetical protein
MEVKMHDPILIAAGCVVLGLIFVGLIVSMWFAMRDEGFGH